MVLVLNASFEPLNVCSTRRALVLVLKGTAEAVEVTNEWMHSTRFSTPKPSVIRLMEYIHIPFAVTTQGLSRKNIYLRDHHTCQYCGREFKPDRLTLDHVLPKSRGGESSWANLVTSCLACNNKKGNRTPEEAVMPLLKRPQAYTFRVNRQIIRYLARANGQWAKYLL